MEHPHLSYIRALLADLDAALAADDQDEAHYIERCIDMEDEEALEAAYEVESV